jgi:hypothetical protein
VQWDGDDGVEFHLSHSEWIGLFTRSGFEIEELRELRIPEGAATTYGWMPHEWARQWPCEEVWKVRKRR